MSKELTSMVRQKRKTEQRVTNENKNSFIYQLNKIAKDYQLPKVSKSATVKQINNFKNQYVDHLTYSIVSLAIDEGNSIIAEIEGRDLKQSEDFQSKRLGQYSKRLAEAKRVSDRKITKDENEFIDRGNNNIKGYGNENLMKLFEKTKNSKEVEALINEIKTQNPKNVFYDKQLDVFERVFQKVEIFREDDLNKIKEKMKSLDMQSALDKVAYLLETLDTYGSPDNIVGKWDGDETELANARLDDMLIQFGLKPSASKKQLKQTLEKYKSK